jgi:GTPase SAR1 family protein
MGWWFATIDDYLIFDCPGQIELYSHLPVMKLITESLAKWGYRTCVVYCIDRYTMLLMALVVCRMRHHECVYVYAHVIDEC